MARNTANNIVFSFKCEQPHRIPNWKRNSIRYNQRLKHLTRDVEPCIWIVLRNGDNLAFFAFLLQNISVLFSRLLTLTPSFIKSSTLSIEKVLIPDRDGINVTERLELSEKILSSFLLTAASQFSHSGVPLMWSSIDYRVDSMFDLVLYDMVEWWVGSLEMMGRQIVNVVWNLSAQPSWQRRWGLIMQTDLPHVYNSWHMIFVSYELLNKAKLRGMQNML